MLLLLSLLSPRDASSEPHCQAAGLDHGCAATSSIPPQPSLTSFPARARLPTPRFSEYGTPEFASRCPFAAQEVTQKRDCVRLVRHMYRGEGIAHYVDQIFRAYLQAHQVGCLLHLDYGPDIQLTQSVIPPPGAPDWSDPEAHLPGMSQVVADCMAIGLDPNKWNFPKCASFHYNFHSVARNFGLESLLAPIYFRNRHSPISEHVGEGQSWLKKEEYAPFLDSPFFPGFHIDDSFACILGKTLTLAPAITSKPEVVSFLTKLRDPSSLSIALYVRVPGLSEGRGEATLPGLGTHPYVKCARHLENMYSEGFDTVTWIVITNSDSMRKLFLQYESHAHQPTTYSWRRRVLVTTTAEGTHTRLAVNNQHELEGPGPTNQVIAEGMLDFFLLGEVDLVVTDVMYSFGSLGGMRTARPVYSISSNNPHYQLLGECKLVTARYPEPSNQPEPSQP
eukprot:g83325.t1